LRPYPEAIVPEWSCSIEPFSPSCPHLKSG
jgi:hypothetical protein